MLHLPVCFLDLLLSRIWLDTKLVVKFCFLDHLDGAS
jgi:hypothetical protein